jgi:hypothetical protein
MGIRLIVFAGLFITLSAAEAGACTCVIVKHRTEYRRARAVFIGEVISRDVRPTLPERLKDWGIDEEVEFEVERIWKGPKVPRLRVFVDYDLTGCGGFIFRVGQKYLIYAFERELVTSTACSRSRPLSWEDEQSRKEMRQLRSRVFRLFAKLDWL